MGKSNIHKDLEEYFSKKERRSDIRVRELMDIIMPYLSLARMDNEESYEKMISEIKSFNAPMTKKNWEVIVDHSVIRELNHE